MLWRYETEFYLKRPGVATWLDEMVRTHDVVTCEYPLLAPLLAGFCQKWGRPLVVTSHDLLFELHGMAPQEKELLKRREIEALRVADARVFCNDSERQLFDKLGIPGLTIRNTSDVRSVGLGGELECQQAIVAELKLPSAKYCLFVGSDHEPNRRAAEEMRKLAKMTPELSFVVLGKCCEPLVDGICADKPVVAPANSWMSEQLNGSQSGATFVSGNPTDFTRAVQAAVTNIAVHREAAGALGRNFRDYHNPQSFLEQLRQV